MRACVIAMRCRAQLSWRLPPRSRRWRRCLPELASSGATPAWRASWASVSKRSIGPISSEQLRGAERTATGQREQRRSGLLDPFLELAVEGDDGASQRCGSGRRARVRSVPAPSCLRDSIGGRPGRARLVRSSAPGGTVSLGIEVVQLPAQPLLSAAPFVDKVVSVIGKQLQLARLRFAGPRMITGAAHATPPWPRRARRSGRTCRVSRPVRRCGAISFGGTRTNDSPAVSSARSSAPLNCRQSSTAHSRSASSAVDQLTSSRAEPTVNSATGRPTSSTATAVNDCLCTSTPINDHSTRLQQTRGRPRADRPHSRRKPRSYQVTLDGLGKAAATQRWQVNPRATCGNGVSRRPPESLPHDGRHHHAKNDSVAPMSRAACC